MFVAIIMRIKPCCGQQHEFTNFLFILNCIPIPHVLLLKTSVLKRPELVNSCF